MPTAGRAGALLRRMRPASGRAHLSGQDQRAGARRDIGAGLPARQPVAFVSDLGRQGQSGAGQDPGGFAGVVQSRFRSSELPRGRGQRLTEQDSGHARVER